MNMIKKKIICLALSLVIVMGASQAQAREVRDYVAPVCTIFNGACLFASFIPTIAPYF
jgi:hypothetical protein